MPQPTPPIVRVRKKCTINPNGPVSTVSQIIHLGKTLPRAFASLIHHQIKQKETIAPFRTATARSELLFPLIKATDIPYISETRRYRLSGCNVTDRPYPV
jgi:hypothetical protein